jgi:short-subunit dehydrogenase
MISLNVTALAVLTTAFSRLNRDRPARLINVASGAGYALFEGSFAYSASKYFVTALTEGLAQELATQGRPMRAQLFAPGPTATDFGVGSVEGSTMAAVRERDRSRSSIKVHSAQQAAQHAMELFDSDAVVGAVRPDMSFSLLGGRHSIGNLIDPDW